MERQALVTIAPTESHHIKPVRLNGNDGTVQDILVDSGYPQRELLQMRRENLVKIEPSTPIPSDDPYVSGATTIKAGTLTTGSETPSVTTVTYPHADHEVQPLSVSARLLMGIPPDGAVVDKDSVEDVRAKVLGLHILRYT